LETFPPGRTPYGPEAGFSVHNGVRVRRDDDGGREALAQYIIRNTFSVEKLTYIEETATVIYRSKPVLNLIQ
jgi:hypothetical protein